MRKLRHFIISLSLACLVPMTGHAWKKIVDCSNNQVVVDTYSPRGQVDFFQIVIRSESLIQELKEAHAIFFYRINGQGELIIPLSRVEEGVWTFQGTHDATRFDGRLYHVTRFGDDIIFRAFSTTQSGGGDYQLLDLLIALQIKQCQW